MERTFIEVVVLSGKGGTGKTSVTASLVHLFKELIFVDADVDAANLHLIIPHTVEKMQFFMGTKKPVLDHNACNSCNKCVEICRFEAIDEGPVFDPYSCEGCGACAYICPTDAITMEKHESGKWFTSRSPYGPFIHAALGVGEENSGKLVAHVRGAARELAAEMKMNLILIDGPPGIGCPVISTLSGASYAILVTEPTVSGVHDMSRMLEVIDHFQLRAGIIINKYDLNPDLVVEIESFAKERKIALLGKIPYDTGVSDAIRKRTIPYHEAASFRSGIDHIFERLQVDITKY